MVPSVEDSRLVTLTALAQRKDGLPPHLYRPEARGPIPSLLSPKILWMMRYIVGSLYDNVLWVCIVYALFLVSTLG